MVKKSGVRGTTKHASTLLSKGKKIKARLHKSGFLYHPEYALANSLLGLIFYLMVIYFLHNIFQDPDCRSIDKDERLFFYTFCWINIIGTVLVFVFNTHILSWKNTVQRATTSAVTSVFLSVLTIVLASMMIHYLDNLFAKEECRRVDPRIRQFLYGVNYILIVIQALVLISTGVSLFLS